MGWVSWAGGFCLFILMPHLLVSMTLAQLPFGQAELAQWQHDVPPDSEAVVDDGPVPAGAGRVPHTGYIDDQAQPPSGVPLRGPLQHWSDTHPKPLLGCRFRDPNYLLHTGVDLPVNRGTPVYATMSGLVVWASENGPWGLLVVIENGDYQIWLAHNEGLNVAVGDYVPRGAPVALSGNSGRSSGPHVHYGIKYFSDSAAVTGAWVNPEAYFSAADVIAVGCGR